MPQYDTSIDMSSLSVISAGSKRTVTSAQAIDQLRFWEQGDESMYTLENVQARYENRFHEGIVRVINEHWWPWVLNAVPIEGWDGNCTTQWTVPRPNHEAQTMVTLKALLEPDEEWNEAEALQMANDTWDSDTKNKDQLTRTLYCDSLFELADVYVRFSWASHPGVTRPPCSRLLAH